MLLPIQITEDWTGLWSMVVVGRKGVGGSIVEDAFNQEQEMNGWHCAALR